VLSVVETKLEISMKILLHFARKERKKRRGFPLQAGFLNLPYVAAATPPDVD